MRTSFQSYVEHRKSSDLSAKFDNLCETIAFSGVSFENYWLSHGMPTLLESHYADEKELLSELFGAFRNRRPMSPAAPAHTAAMPDPFHDQNLDFSTPQAPTGNGPYPKVDPSQSIEDQAAQMEKDQKRQEKLQAYQQKADAAVKNVKQRFIMAMRDFLKGVTDSAKSQDDPHSWQVAKNFYDQIIKTVQPVMNNFSMKAEVGPAPYKQQFNTERSAMMANKQAGMKQQLQQKFANQGEPSGLHPSVRNLLNNELGNNAEAQPGMSPAVSNHLNQELQNNADSQPGLNPALSTHLGNEMGNNADSETNFPNWMLKKGTYPVKPMRKHIRPTPGWFS